MRFEWDEAKRQLNLRRHRIDFVDAVEVFQVETVTVIDDRYEYGEMRFLTLGLVNVIVVAVSHTETSDVIRIISARKAQKDEEIRYFKEIRD